MTLVEEANDLHRLPIPVIDQHVLNCSLLMRRADAFKFVLQVRELVLVVAPDALLAFF